MHVKQKKYFLYFQGEYVTKQKTHFLPLLQNPLYLYSYICYILIFIYWTYLIALINRYDMSDNQKNH